MNISSERETADGRETERKSETWSERKRASRGQGRQVHTDQHRAPQRRMYFVN